MKWNENIMPKKDEWVLVTDGETMQVGQLRNGEFQDINCYTIPDVKYWSSLPEQPERSKREDLIKEMGKFKPKSLKPEDGYFPPPWNMYDHLEKTIGWFEFQKALKEDPKYYLGCGALNTMET